MDGRWDSPMAEFVVSGLVLGLSAGFAPGPLLTLVVSHSLVHGAGEGFKVALAPLITDVPIVAASLFLIARISSFSGVFGVVALLGAAVVFYMGIDGMRSAATAPPDAGTDDAQSFKKGAVINALSPHPYLFWLSVGAPIMVRG